MTIRRSRRRAALTRTLALALALLGSTLLPDVQGADAGQRRGWMYADSPAWDISHEGLPFRLTWAWASPLDPLGRLLRCTETRWTAGIGYAKVYHSFDPTTGAFRSPGGHAALASAGREFRWGRELWPGGRDAIWLPTVLIEFGAHGASRPFPADGTRFNFKLLPGVEWEAPSRRWAAGVMWLHFSNADVLSPNAGYDGLAIRISWRR
jgi:hypothetical protein